MNSNALGYLLRTKMRSQLRNFFKKPVRLVYFVLFIGLFVVTIIGGNKGQVAGKIRDFSELTAGLNALLLIIFSITFNNGINSGGTFFKMADVNLIFPSPLSRRSVLFYALIQQMGNSLFVGIFIFFQYSTLHVNYNISVLGLVLIFIVYSLAVFLSQTMAMLLYTYISDSDKKKNTVKTVFYVIIIALGVYFGLNVLQNGNEIVKTLVKTANSLPVLVFPFAGWLGAFASNIFKGNLLESALWLFLSAGAFFGILVAMSRSNRDYYEDVLASAETVQSALNAVKDGVAPEATPRHIKVGKVGIGKGEGASVFFYKHLLENRRASKIIISKMSMLFIVMSVVFSFFMKGIGIIPAASFSIYMMVFSVVMGRFNRELTKPYIYLIPEPPLKKMIYGLAESIPTQLLESVVALIPISIIVGASAVECLLCIIARTSYGALFLASSVAIDRIWGGSVSKVAGIFIYIFIDVLTVAPGIALSIILINSGIVLLTQAVTAAICVTICNICISALVLFLCRNMLQYAET